MTEQKLGFATRAIHGPELKPNRAGPLATPIVQTSTFTFESAEQGARIFSGEEPGFYYGRAGNPTQAVFQDIMAGLEGGEASLATGSGMAAISATALTLCSAGDHLVTGHSLYSTTTVMLNEFCGRMGIESTWVDLTDLDQIADAIKPNTKMLYLESPLNPVMDVVDIAAAARLAHEKGATVVVDNTFATPYNQNPLALGADIVVHSATKYIGGHGDVLAGVIVGRRSTIDLIRSESLSRLGSIVSPFDAFLLIRGLKTLEVRMERHNENAMRVAAFLKEHGCVERVRFPFHAEHPGYEVARRQMRGPSGTMSFDVAGGFEAAKRMLNHVRLCSLAVSLGDTDTLIEHPASMTHAKIGPERLAEAGIDPGLVRISVGLETIDDIIDDLDQALNA